MMDYDFEDFELTQEDLTELENVEINFLNNSFQLSSDDELIVRPSRHKRRRCVILSDSDESDAENITIRVTPDISGNTRSSGVWTAPKGNQRSIIPFTENPGLTPHLRFSMCYESPAAFYKLMVSDEIFELIADCTNKFALEKIAYGNEASKFARLLISSIRVILYTDNWYTSLDLARKLLEKETHLVGTLRKNRKHLPKTVISTKLKKGAYIAKESTDGITVMKWRDKREVLVLSTKHSTRFHTVTKRGKIVSKPKIICDYNRAKGAVDLSDQMAAYSTPLHFRKQLLEHLCQKLQEPEVLVRPRRIKHVLSKRDGMVRVARRTCRECYKEIASTMGSKIAKNKSQKVITYCEQCPSKPSLCLPCFNKLH
ncbi:unnamed protein product [Colias eurytheme]|nr:unnamed protein product [Colias eurytheme]CAG4969524.1 unnamed protein product [Colias eurytheme]